MSGLLNPDVDEQIIGVSISSSFNSNPLFLGYDNYIGNLDNFHFWNTALSVEEIQEYINCPPSGNEEGLIGYWNFEEGLEEGQVLDLSLNDNNGTINESVW